MKLKVKKLDKLYEELAEQLERDEVDLWDEELQDELPRQPYRSSSSGEWGLKGNRLC